MTNLIGLKDGLELTQTGGKLGFGKGNRGIEADNFELGYLNTPIANPSITNLTLVGPGSAPTTGTWLENDAMKLRRGTKGILQTLFSVDG
jgi:hypothetical protein